jgi:hypothetical protein
MKFKTILRITKEVLIVGGLIGLFFGTVSLYLYVDKQKEYNTGMATELLKLVKTTQYLNQENKFLDMTLNYRIHSESKKILEQDKVDSRILEKKLQLVNVVIYGSGIIDKQLMQWSGSGVTLKYKGQFYILSAAHLAPTMPVNLAMYENENYISDLEIIKIDVQNDLILLRPTKKDIEPSIYTELGEVEPLTAEKVYIVGNPARIEDVVSEGRVAEYEAQWMIVKNDTWFGNSGGGVYNSKGQLVGIVSAISAVRNASEKDIEKNLASREYEYPPYMLDLMIRLNIIKEFLRDIN